MLLNIDLNTLATQKCAPKALHDFGKRESDLQRVLYDNLDRLFRDDELLPIMQSRAFQEEPDVMAWDKEGNLYIFELKAWESNHSNLLQALRYAQIFGSAKYEELNTIFKKHSTSDAALGEVHKERFDSFLSKEDYNRRQVLVIVVNGLDFRTREAVRYWRSCKLDVRPWVYRVYGDGPSASKIALEISCFSVEDNPYEDLAAGYYILNTNSKHGLQDHNDMINNQKAAAYFSPWKRKIQRLGKGDRVFLYQSGRGIVAMGQANGELKIRDYQDNPRYKDEEYWMKLTNFICVDPPFSAAEIKSLTDVEYVFMSTMFGLGMEAGEKLAVEVKKRAKCAVSS
jgi:hypothetical protein